MGGKLYTDKIDATSGYILCVNGQKDDTHSLVLMGNGGLIMNTVMSLMDSIPKEARAEIIMELVGQDLENMLG